MDNDAMVIATDLLVKFQSECTKMAKENWSESQAEMLERLFNAVCLSLPYDYTEEMFREARENG